MRTGRRERRSHVSGGSEEGVSSESASWGVCLGTGLCKTAAGRAHGRGSCSSWSLMISRGETGADWMRAASMGNLGRFEIEEALTGPLLDPTRLWAGRTRETA